MAETVEDALHTLVDAPGQATIIAGGTDLWLETHQSLRPAVHTLVDVTRIPELCALEIRQGELFIGASLTHSRITASPLVQQHARALAEACGMIGGPQVRNTATIGGNVAHALPAADGAIALLALDAQAEVASLEERRRLPLAALFDGPGKSTLHPTRDLLVGFFVPLSKSGQTSAFGRVMRPQGIPLPILNLAIWLERRDEKIALVRIVSGPCGPVPTRLFEAEGVLKDKAPASKIRRAALQAILSQAQFRTSRHRATAEYRRHLAGVLFEEVFQKAWERAAG
ncbi:MAG: FAD binding domain-containing protein [Anaerolineales bacterium]